MNIEYSTPRIFNRAHIHGWSWQLTELFIWLPSVVDNIVITSAWRPVKIHPNDSKIHTMTPLRAADLRSRVFDQPEKIAEAINNKWIYDPGRPNMKVCLYHNTGRGWHFHLQVHPKTERR